ncbi:AAA family ATPase [Variovorax ureilyticus]|uniref:bifunctional aminoglycoside phosphotransferase/ATP-binding protein n=1 Tax=Variovorax ureilyticus TaxID=1836198 RepID=UPI003D67529D
MPVSELNGPVPRSRLEKSAAVVQALALHLGARVIETHISWVLLTPAYAYKVKKPVRLAFLDYATLSKRRHFCHEEVRLNRRTAPSLYLGVARITGEPSAPEIDGTGPMLDYAVRMRRFADGALFGERLAAGALSARDVDGLAAMLAAAHAAAPVKRRATAGHVPPLRRALAALEGARPMLSAAESTGLQAWLDAGARKLAPQWASRRRSGHVRECHGDLHLDNIVELDGAVAGFDAIEFDPSLRWIDIAEDAAFPAMDFAARGRPDFASALPQRMARRHRRAGGCGRPALCARLPRTRARPGRTSARGRCDAAAAYVRAALEWSNPALPRLVITHGLPGSGKTFQSQGLLEQHGAIRVRSDVERKRLFGLGALENSRAHGLDIYSREATARTYERLFALARAILDAGFSVVIDAAFLRRGERDAAHELARQCGVRFEILACEAPVAVLRERLAARTSDASEADAVVMQRLQEAADPLEDDEPLLPGP